jgi:hypothetical protein
MMEGAEGMKCTTEPFVLDAFIGILRHQEMLLLFSKVPYSDS